MRDRFDRQLRILNDDITQMGALIEESITGAVKAVKENDTETAEQIMKADENINHIERDIEELCMKLLLRQQPVAGDLRLISAALKMITDMERIGDQAADICEIIVKSPDMSGAVMPLYISKMAAEAVRMVSVSVDAFVKKDYKLASKVEDCDVKVDNMFRQIKEDLIETIRLNADSDERAIDIMMIAKYIEKIADHAVNIADWVMYSITGEHSAKKSTPKYH